MSLAAARSGVEGRRLLVTVLECRKLKQMDGRFGSNDVFVSVDVDGQELATHTVHDGGRQACDEEPDDKLESRHYRCCEVSQQKYEQRLVTMSA